jgi:hypothetical protein
MAAIMSQKASHEFSAYPGMPRLIRAQKDVAFKEVVLKEVTFKLVVLNSCVTEDTGYELNTIGEPV